MKLPDDQYMPPPLTGPEVSARERCSRALAYMRLAYRELIDAGAEQQFRVPMMTLAQDIKAALGGKENDGLDD